MLLLLGTLLAACAPPAAPPALDAFPTPPELVAQHGVVSVALDVVNNPHTLMPAFSYAGAVGVAPTLRVHPGDRIEIRLHDGLPANDPAGNAVNLHFHGLATAPRAPGDDPLDMLALPGQTLHYVVHVGADQQPGLYWYHPHAHGATFRQVGLGGMSGAIVVEGIERDVPALAGLRQRLLIVRDVADDLDDNELRTHPELAPPDLDEGAPNAPCRRSGGTHLTVNGSVAPAIGFEPGETQFFRLLNATATRFLDISLAGASLRLVALDGVPLDAYPGAAASVPFRHLVVAPGARAEFTVTGAPPGARLETACYDAGPDGDADPAAVLATIADAPRAAPGDVAAPSAPPRRRNPLAAPLPAPVRDRQVTFTEHNGAGGSIFKINGRSYAPGDAPLFVARSGTVERWTIVNATREAHAFHIHQVHFVALSIDGVPQPRYWRDTLTTAPGDDGPRGTFLPSRTVLLVDFRNPVVRGTFLFHCHLLDHEDGGMMAKVKVI